jgi:hypothetical protein
MPSIPPLITHTPDSQSLYLTQDSLQTALPSGIAKGLVWTAGGSGTYYATIPVPGIGLTASSVCLATAATPKDLNITDALNCWVVTATCTGLAGGAILVSVAANPSSPTNFWISWSIAKV